MSSQRRTPLDRIPRIFFAAAAAGALGSMACQAPREPVGSAASAAFTNGGFELGSPGAAPPNWTVAPFLNPANTGFTPQTPQSRAGLNLLAGGMPLTTVLNGVGQPDPDLGAAASLRWSRYGSQCAIVNSHGNNDNVNSLSQVMTVSAGEVDPFDGQIHVRLAFAPVLQNPAHPLDEQPYYFIQVTNLTQLTTLYTDFQTPSSAGLPWKSINSGMPSEIDYLDWTLVDVAPGGAAINLGDQVKLEIIAAGCALGTHFGEIYVDGVGATLPGIFVSATGPAQVNPLGNLTYALTYRNEATAAETGATLTFTTPPSTTFQSLSPPAGWTCNTPGVGLTGSVVCTDSSPLLVHGSGSLSITVSVNAGTTGQILAANYGISSDQETPILGNRVATRVGCSIDVDCGAGTWCDEIANTCTPTLQNGTPIPIDPPHVGPVLNGTCTVSAGVLVCAAGVCDVADNRCGYLNGDGACTLNTGGTVCRSGVCDPDGKCGYANGDGPCTSGNGGTVCRSGSCSISGTCQPAGGCNADGDCAGGQWCDEAIHTCTAQLANGAPIPTDPPHVSPVLNGTCTPPVGALVCASGVCDTRDNECGLANGDGPCTPANAGVVCRSGACSMSGVCEPASGCATDGDCAGGQWCDEAVHTCTAQLSNSAPIPTDPPHVNPILNGICTAAAGALVCASGVCDTRDNECGLANGDGPCTAQSGAMVCRSGFCGTGGTCAAMPSGTCNVDANCPATQWCKESTHKCTAKLANGNSIPTDAAHTNPVINAVCMPAVGAVVCASGVCDVTDNKCGYANNDGTCTAANAAVVCRSGACSVSGTCEPVHGCEVDGDCAAGQWCKEATHACAAQLANNAVLPTDAPHTNPTLNGVCTPAAGALVCASGACDPLDNRCGLAVGDGPCTPGQAAICRSGVCSVSGLCEPAGGCDVDADCPVGKWCKESTHACTATLANGVAIPSDAPHVNPTLSGVCTPAAGALVCASGACDPLDNKCGYAVGDGPCTQQVATVCRSGVCSVSGLCEPAGGCDVDADCPAGKWCKESTHACTATLAKGGAIPKDPPHVNPTLNGVCTASAGALVCTSHTCSTMTNKCL